MKTVPSPILRMRAVNNGMHSKIVFHDLVCDAGFTMNPDRTACVECAVNTWKSTTSAEPCTPCHANAITNGLTGQTNNTCGKHSFIFYHRIILIA